MGDKGALGAAKGAAGLFINSHVALTDESFSPANPAPSPFLAVSKLAGRRRHRRLTLGLLVRGRD